MTKRKDMMSLIFAIRDAIEKHAETVPVKNRRHPTTIMESRFTPVQESFDTGMMSCGAMTNLSAEMLRNLGFEVRLVHGECAKSVDHAWISVFDPESGEWVQYDTTRQNLDVPDSHMVKEIVDSWEEIRDQILSDHKTMNWRRFLRKIPLIT